MHHHPEEDPAWSRLQREAKARDRSDRWSEIRAQFLKPDRPWYFDGNSLGPLSRPARRAVRETLDQWRHLAVSGWSEGEVSWFDRAAWLSDRLGPWFGARSGEISLGGTTTQQLHQLLATYYHPSPERSQILVDAGAFPTDHYAAESHIRWHGLDPAAALRTVAPDDGPWLTTEAIVEALTPEVAIAILPSVVYTTGQRLAIAPITRAAHEQGVFVIWDLSHSAGVLAHHLHDDAVDAAVFCTYKYLNGGPGSPAAVFVHQSHWPPTPGLWGWWGSDPVRQFQMAPAFTPAPDARALQLGTVSPLALAPLSGSLDLLEHVGITAVEQRAQDLTDFLIEAAESHLVPRGITIQTPRSAEHRGGHVALAHPSALDLSRALRQAGVTPDFRPPNLIRLCPAPLFTRFQDVATAVHILADILDEGRYAAAADNSPVW